MNTNENTKFDFIYDYIDGIARCILTGKFGYIKQDGTYLIEPIFDDAWDFKNGFAPIKKNDKWTYLSTNGTFLTDFIFDEANFFHESKIAKVLFNDVCYIINFKGQFINKNGFVNNSKVKNPKISEIFILEKDVFFVQIDKEESYDLRYGYIPGSEALSAPKITEYTFAIIDSNNNPIMCTDKHIKFLEKSSYDCFKYSKDSNVIRCQRSRICFITTICDSFNKTDNCGELTSIRQFRDTRLSNQPEGEKIVNYYYQVAPHVVDAINKTANSENNYLGIYNNYLVPFL